MGRGSGGGDITLEQQAESRFYHALAILHAPTYRLENAGALQQDWPRVPLPTSRDALEDSAALGRQVAALLDSETPVIGVTQGDPRPDLKTIAVPTTMDGRAPDFAVTARWGHFGKGSAVMPGRGRTVSNDDGLDILPERYHLLARGAVVGVGLYAGRLSGVEEVAQLSRGERVGAGALCRRSAGIHAHRPPDRGTVGIDRRARHQLSPCDACGIGMSINGGAQPPTPAFNS